MERSLKTLVQNKNQICAKKAENLHIEAQIMLIEDE